MLVHVVFRNEHPYFKDLKQQPPISGDKVHYLYIKIMCTKLICSSGVHTLSFLKNSVLEFVQCKIFVPPLIQVVCYQH